ncbi:hypothetical protein GMB34_13640 [Turicibacter sanguinis]|nr:hypothetical protein [Turicibacter sanguinis]MTN85260.1 hypothetical protein [Turicibacter sanguinis]MTN88081.1 hypothetical protein [Turicibacter sanguinis]MTN90935.1 hypothetical protein [Turicibacter sanguinis]MTN93764.1 hypothetical protein [Turicibacter sanguinis]
MSSTVTLETLQVVMEANTKKFNEEIKKVQNQVKAMTDSVNKQVSKVKSAISSITKSIAGLYALGKVGQYIKNSLQSAMQVEASLQQVARTMGESTQSFLKWAKTNALSFNMAQSDALKFGATYSNLVSSFLTDTNQITGATTELLKASSIIASATGRTMDDVMERIRSGLLGNTEAIEDLGVNVDVALLETTEAFKRLANGKSWNQLSFQTQQQIRLMAILEQTSSKFGDEVFQNTNSSLQQLVAILKDVALNLGNAFLPIANVVIPLLSKMAMWLRTVTGYFATFMQALFGVKSTIKDTAKSTISLGNSSTALGDSIEAAGTKAKRSVAGFDEVNQLQQTDASSGSDSSGGGAGLGLDNIEYELSEVDGAINAIPVKIQEMVNKIKSTIKNVVDFIAEHKELILAIIAGLVTGVATYLGVMALGGTLGDVIVAFQLFPAVVAEACSGVIASIGAVVGGISWPAVAIAAIVATIVAAFVYLWQTSAQFRQSLIDGWNALIGALTPYIDAFIGLLKLIVDFIATLLTPVIILIWEVAKTVVDNVVRIVMAFWKNVLAPFVKFFGECAKMIIDGLAEIWASWKPTIEKIGAILILIWDTCLKPVIDWLGTVFIQSFENARSYIEPILESLKTMFQGVVDFIVGVFTGNWQKALEGLYNIFSTIINNIVNSFETGINWIISLVNSAVSGINTLIDGINKIPGVNIPTIGSIPKVSLPRLARGGIVDGETNFGNYIAGEAGKEMIVPLENTPFVNKLASALGTAVMQAMMVSQPSGRGGSGTAEVVLNVDGKTFARALIPEFEKENNRTYNAIFKLA